MPSGLIVDASMGARLWRNEGSIDERAARNPMGDFDLLDRLLVRV